MKVIVFVEGPSDKRAMQYLLAQLLEKKRNDGVLIEFFEAPIGDKKKSIIYQVPVKAVNILKNDPYAYVIAMPDLYPRNKGFTHETFPELHNGIMDVFVKTLKKKSEYIDNRIIERFKVFCFKYDLEALILAAESQLAIRLKKSTIKVTWKIPVEDQNHNNPPKRIVESLFAASSDKYKDTVDAPLILGAADYQEICSKCPQCFKPFVDFLEQLQ